MIWGFNSYGEGLSYHARQDLGGPQMLERHWKRTDTPAKACRRKEASSRCSIFRFNMCVCAHARSLECR